MENHEPRSDAKAPRRHSRIWLTLLIIISITALAGRILIARLQHFPGESAVRSAGLIRAGDVINIGPKSSAVDHWAVQTDVHHRVFVAKRVERSGAPVMPAAFCAFDLYYINSYGGNLTLVERAGRSPPGSSQTKAEKNSTSEALWKLRWRGRGGTLWADPKSKDDDDLDCGTDAIILMSEAQINELLDILAGRPITEHHSQPASGAG